MMSAVAMLAQVACVLAVVVLFDGIAARSEAATTCSTTAATASTYSAAAAVVEYADCTTKVVRVVTSSDGTTSLDLSSKQIVYVESLPSVMKLDLSKNSFTSMQDFAFPSGLTKLTATNGKLASLHLITFPDTVVALNFSTNPITSVSGVVFPSSLKTLSITSSVKLREFEARQTDATLFASLESFNVSMTTSLVCSDSAALLRYVQDTLLCVLADDVFNAKYGIKGESSANGSVDAASATTAPELQEANGPRRSKFLLFAAISLSLACAGLMSTLAPRTLYERYQKKQYLNLRNKKKQQKQEQQQPPVVKPTILQVDAPELQRDSNVIYWDL